MKKPDYYKFQLTKDTPNSIRHCDINIEIASVIRDMREKSKKARNRDTAEAIECQRISIEHIKAIEDFIYMPDKSSTG